MKKTKERLSSDYPYRNCEELCKRLDSLLAVNLALPAELHHKLSQAVIAVLVLDIQNTLHLEALLEDRDRTLQDLFLRGLIPLTQPKERRP